MKAPERRRSLGRSIQQIMRWLAPGLHVKRWLVLLLGGLTLLAVGLAMALLDIYRTAGDNQWWLNLLSLASLRFLDRTWRVIIFGGIGVAMLLAGIWGLNRSMLQPFLRPGRDVVDALADYRRRERGPRVVVIGGGHGLSTLLRGLKAHTRNLTAVVSVADDGGSSGQLRRTLGILPPGDIRNCLAALSDDETLLTQLFQYRFSGTEGLDGHSFGNLFISALTEVTGSFEQAVVESASVLGVAGRVLPATLHNVRLVADVQLPHQAGEVHVEGESQIPGYAGRVRRVWLEPNNASAFPPVIRALLAADMIVVGPGSLYTSLLPNLLVQDLLAALRVSRALKVFVCNIATQPGETEAYSCRDHVRALEEHVGEDLFDLVVCNDYYPENGLAAGSHWVTVDPASLSDTRLYRADLLDAEHPWRHDSIRLAQTLIDLYHERTGPLSERDL